MGDINRICWASRGPPGEDQCRNCQRGAVIGGVLCIFNCVIHGDPRPETLGDCYSRLLPLCSRIAMGQSMCPQECSAKMEDECRKAGLQSPQHASPPPPIKPVPEMK